MAGNLRSQAISWFETRAKQRAPHHENGVRLDPKTISLPKGPRASLEMITDYSAAFDGVSAGFVASAGAGFGRGLSCFFDHEM